MFPHALGPFFIISNELHPCSEKTLIDMFCRFDLLRAKKCFTRATDATDALAPIEILFLIKGTGLVALFSVSDVTLISGATLALKIFFLLNRNLFDFMFGTGFQIVFAGTGSARGG